MRKPSRFVEPQGRIGLYCPESERLAGSRCLFDQAFDHLGASALPSQSAVYEQLAEDRKTATTLGIRIPPTLLARADEVIE